LPATYFISSRTWESRPLFVTEPPCNIFVETLQRHRAAGAFELPAFVLMPEHFHVLITPSEGTTIERAVQYIKGGSARRMGKELIIRFPVWQRGFSDYRTRDGQDFAAHVQYLELNPVKRRLAAGVKDYWWSSASGRYPADDVPQRLKPRSIWRSFGTAKAVP
jgi:putative transposase